jgi:hypothetical protein
MKAKQKKLFVKALAKLLAGEEIIEMVRALPQEWNRLACAWLVLRYTTPVSGHMTVEEAVKILTEFLE